MAYIAVVGKANGDTLFQKKLDNFIEIQQFAEALDQDLVHYLRRSKLHFDSRDRQHFLEDIGDYFKCGTIPSFPYLYWITENIFISISNSSIDNYDDWKKGLDRMRELSITVNNAIESKVVSKIKQKNIPWRPDPIVKTNLVERFDFVRTTDVSIQEDADIGKIQKIQPKKSNFIITDNNEDYLL